MTERVVEFGTGNSLVGVLNEPPEASGSTEMPIVIFLNSGTLHRVGPCRLYVRLARQLAQLNIPSLRFDFSGIGDSPPRSDGKAFHEYSISEVGAAIDYLSRTSSAQKFILFGICSGADTAFYAGITDDRVNGLILVDGFAFRSAGFYWHHYKKRIFNLTVWTNFLRNPMEAISFFRGAEVAAADVDPVDEVVFDRDWPSKTAYYQGIRKLVGRDAHLYYLFTSGAQSYLNHKNQLVKDCAELKNYSRVTTEFLPSADHMISDTSDQQHVIESIAGWVSNTTRS